jgi:hypothetical protein
MPTDRGNRNSWTKADDTIVGMSYLDHGATVTDALRANLPGHAAGSIRMRLQNFEYLATGGASGLAHASAQTHEVWAAIHNADEQRVAGIRSGDSADEWQDHSG